ncbi:MAG: hypothetical protein MUF39_05325 [Cyclobacteriaceae bacterium]|nr:hypothetical protein [Cyclobacteriaceae bacterium]
MIVLITIGCKDNVLFDSNRCEVYTGYEINEQFGRIYKWTDSSSNTYFYYIGNVDPAFKAGGFVPCNYPLADFIPVGKVVRYSGKIKMAEDACEPIFFGIELSSLVKE